MAPQFQKNKVIQLLLAATITISSYLIGCSQNQETETKPSDNHLKNSASTFIYNMIPEQTGADISSAYSVAVNAFSVNLLSKIYSTDSYHGKNVVVSPYCVSRNLAIITEAATGTTQKELSTIPLSISSAPGNRAWSSSPEW
jgi:serine protease inhibitor